MSEDDLKPVALTKEKNLWQLYIQAKRIPTNKFNTISTFLIFIVCLITCWLSSWSVIETITLVRKIGELGFSSTLSLLGFLVAGFTIFATVSNPSMLVKMSEIRHPDSGLSYLKHTFFVLVRVFLYYLTYAFICFSVIYFGAPNGILEILISFSAYPEFTKQVLSNISFVVLVTGQFFLLVQLKSFIFNIHHSVMAAVRWRAEGHD